uniref:PINc domain-containing protein n=1 Tax=Angiostrongylus cantonensis TaxID=6313 RepID=A0A0K0DF59_ANGCA
MADGDGQGCSSSATSTTRTRKARPEIQIYRPASPGSFEDCGDSGSTTPDASISSEQHDSPSKLVNSRGFSRSGRFSADKKVCNLNDVNMATSVRKRNARDYNDRQASRMSSAQNSTQSLYDPQQSEGYLDYRSSFRRRQGNFNIGKAPSPVRFRRKSQQHTERSSMRAESGRRNVAHRKRNDSLNSTQSECLAQLPDRSAVDATSETQSVADDAISSSSLSYMQLCQSFESLGSFDWSKEVESEYNAKHSEEAEEKSPTESSFRFKDSDRSSIRGSIVEEEYDCSGVSSGERTPTEESGDEKHWNNRREKRLSRPARDDIQSSCYSSRNFAQTGNKTSRLTGRITIDRSNTECNMAGNASPLASRISGVSLRNELQKPYRPLAMRVSGKSDGADSDVRHSKKTTTPSSEPQKVTDFPVYREISNNEGPIMQKINDSITSLLLRVRKRDIKAAEKVVELSDDLCEIYYKLLPRDISFTFTMNLEQHLWKQAFYKPIEVFKSVVNSPKDSTRAFRAALLSLLNNGISFYMRVIDLYEKELHVDLEKLILFSFDQNEAFWDVCHRPNHDSGRKIATKSYSRHLIALGDLKRYKTLIEGSEDYSDARAMYLRSAQLWPSSGHCYNQLAVIAYFSASLFNVVYFGQALDEIFYCVRALSSGHPFEVARDRLYARLAAMKRKLIRFKVDKYEPLLDHECGEVREDAELAASADRPYELWLDNEDSDIETNEEDAHIFRSFLEQQPSKLAALVEQESSPVTAGQLIQIVALFIYAVHCNAIVGWSHFHFLHMFRIRGDEDVCSVQQQQAVRALVTVFGALLRISRVLPAVCVLCEWFSCPIASAIYRTMPSVEPLSLSIIEIDTWHLLAEIANELIRWQDSGQLAKIMSSTDTSHSCILPELAFISSFSSVFPPFPRILNYTCPSTDSIETVKPYYVVIDTNAFIDQLCAIQKIVQCERFRVLIPTTVVEELIELQHGEQGSSGVEAVTEGARQAMIWLREQTRQKKTSRLFTLTTRGKRLPIAVVRERAGDDGDLVNDDRILHSCLNFTQLEPAPDGTFSNFKVPQGREIPIIYRNLVLLTDDRVLNMKAMSQHIPCRTVTRFMKWAKIR